MSDLRTAAQQALEALYEETAWFGPTPKGAAAIAALKAALAQQDEPVQKPVAWMFTDREGTEFFEQREDWDGWWTPLYTAPPQRLPLTDEEILKAIGWERAEMYMKLTPNFPVAEAKKETLKNARAIERAHGIGETK